MEPPFEGIMLVIIPPISYSGRIYRNAGYPNTLVAAHIVSGGAKKIKWSRRRCYANIPQTNPLWFRVEFVENGRPAL